MSQREQIAEELTEGLPVSEGVLNSFPGLAYRRRIDRAWAMEFVSEGSEQITGYAPQDLIENREIAYGELIHPDDRETAWNAVRNAVADGRAFQVS